MCNRSIKWTQTLASLWPDVASPGQLNQRGGAGEVKEQTDQGSRLWDRIKEEKIK